MPSNAIRNSSTTGIKSAFKIISKNQFKNKRIIGPRNIYLTDTTQKTDNMDAGNINHNHMDQYIASSIISHCFDGWNYISRGIESVLNGDISSTIHFTYYAELRTVMSLMAAQGIGIFNNKHVYFDSANNPKFLQYYNIPPRRRFKYTTHVVTKELLNAWANSSNHTEEVLKLIIVNNRTLYDWIVASGVTTRGPYSNLVVKTWLKKWSVDLNLFEDQRIRNETSYRPNFTINQINIQNVLNNISTIWSSLEPITDNRFQEIDKYLFRLAIEGVFENTQGKTIRHKDYITFINRMFKNIGESTTQYLYEFLIRKVSPEDHFILKEARKDHRNRQVNKKNPFPMICRAILLLRFATGFVSNFIEDCQVNKAQLKFWWEDIAYKLGIIEQFPTSIPTCDLYTDIRDSMNDIQANLVNISSTRDCTTKFAFETNNLKQFQRTCFWGLGL